METKERIKKNSPIIYSTQRMEALEEAYRLFLDAFTEYSIQNKLTDEQITSFKEQILTAYLEKRASYYFNDKLSDINDYLRKAFSFALSSSLNDENREFHKRRGYRVKKRIVSS